MRARGRTELHNIGRAIYARLEYCRAAFLLRRVKRSTQPSILLIVPWMVIGGVERVNLDITAGLRQRGIDVHIFTTQPADNRWEPKFRSLTPHVWHLENFRTRAAMHFFAYHYIRRAGLTRVLVTNTQEGYLMAATLKHRWPDIHLVDVVHNERAVNQVSASGSSLQRFLDHRVAVAEHLRAQILSESGQHVEDVTAIHNGIDVSQLLAQVSDRYKYRALVG